MKWCKTDIPLVNVEQLVKTIEASVKNGDPKLELLRCVYKLKDEAIIHMLMPYDFLDAKVDLSQIIQFKLYQALGD